MEFGKLPEAALKEVDFSLPKDPSFNKKALVGKAIQDHKIYIGCAKWGRPEWVGKIYPPRTRERDFLKHYVNHYNAIELNATHYKIIGERGTAKWASAAKGKDFLFCPKMYDGITHYGSLKGKEFITNEFFRGIHGFGDHLGPVFIQFSDRFSTKRKEELFTYLKGLPKEFQFFLEVRHADWFRIAETRDELFEFLREQNIGAVITDAAARRDCVHMHLTLPKTFIRFVGNSLHPTDYTRISDWVERIKYWLDHGLKELYFFMHMHDEATSPELTIDLVEKLNQRCGLDILKPELISTISAPPKRRQWLPPMDDD